MIDLYVMHLFSFCCLYQNARTSVTELQSKGKQILELPTECAKCGASAIGRQNHRMQSNRNRIFKTRHEQQDWPSKIGRNSKFDVNALSHPQMTPADCYLLIGQPMPSQCPLVSHNPPLQFSSEKAQLQHSLSKHISLYSILKVVIGVFRFVPHNFQGTHLHFNRKF